MPKVPRLRVPAVRRVSYLGPENYLVRFWDQAGQRMEDADFTESDYDRACALSREMINKSTTNRKAVHVRDNP